MRAELETRPRGTQSRLAEAIGMSTGQVAELLGDDSHYSTYVPKVNQFFGWPAPTPPLMSIDNDELQYLIEEIGEDAQDLMRALKDLPKEERQAHIRLIILRGKSVH